MHLERKKDILINYSMYNQDYGALNLTTFYKAARLAASFAALTGFGDSKIACISSRVLPNSQQSPGMEMGPLVSG